MRTEIMRWLGYIGRMSRISMTKLIVLRVNWKEKVLFDTDIEPGAILNKKFLTYVVKCSVNDFSEGETRMNVGVNSEHMKTLLISKVSHCGCEVN